MVNSCIPRLMRPLFGTQQRWITQQSKVEKPHIPVMKNEVVKLLNLKKGQVFLDMTFGAGGHSSIILQNNPGVKILALDRDPVAYEYALKLKEKYPEQVIPLLGRFTELPDLLKSNQIKQNSIDGILLDLGCSSMQFDQAIRGFSVSKDGPLDMRMDGWRCPNQPTAADVIAQATEMDLVKIFKLYGEEKHYKKIARALIEARYTFTPLKRTSQLCELIEAVLGCDHRLDMLQRRSHVATKVFQGLRIFVNNEVNELNFALVLSHRYLKLGGRLVAISFHSIEDTIVKRHLMGNVIDNAANPLPLKYSNSSISYKEEEMVSFLNTNWQLVNKHVMLPSLNEVDENPRSRSAKLRCAVRIR